MQLVVRFIIATAIAASGSLAAVAQPYPSKPIKLIVPFPAGGPLDVVARMIGQPLSVALGQPLVIDNRAGAAGTVGVEAAAKSPGDGYTLVIGTTGTLASAPSLYPKLGYEPLRAFAPITLLTKSPFIVVVHPTVPATTLSELIALAKSKPGQLHFGTGGNGHLMHTAGEMFKIAAGVDLLHVPYKGIAPAMPDLLAGRTHVMFSNTSTFITHIRSGKLRALAIADVQRTPLLPDLSTASDAGLPGYEVASWFGLLAPTGTPEVIVARLNKEVRTILTTPAVRDTFLTQGDEPAGSTPEQFTAFIASETEKWSRVVRQAGVKID